MEKVQCLNCNKLIIVEELKKGLDVVCKCGCIQRCLDNNEYISRWRVINPFSFEDKRINQKNIDLKEINIDINGQDYYE